MTSRQKRADIIEFLSGDGLQENLSQLLDHFSEFRCVAGFLFDAVQTSEQKFDKSFGLERAVLKIDLARLLGIAERLGQGGM